MCMFLEKHHEVKNATEKVSHKLTNKGDSIHTWFNFYIQFHITYTHTFTT